MHLPRRFGSELSRKTRIVCRQLSHRLAILRNSYSAARSSHQELVDSSVSNDNSSVLESRVKQNNSPVRYIIIFRRSLGIKSSTA
eukprot:scaffold93537_cov28-Prasinocladus_malaysianus.AAC.1